MIDSLRDKIEILLNKLKSTERVYCDFEEIRGLIAFDDSLTVEEKFEAVLDVVCKHCVDTKNENFVARLYGGGSEISYIAEMIISYFNASVHTYETSPFFTVAEEEIIRKVIGYVGYDDSATGIFMPGGSLCTIVGMICARHKKYPASKHVGLNQPVKIITSIDSHYSIEKAAIMMGIGIDNVIKLDFKTTTPRQLDEILENNDVIMINSTFGTTCEGTLETVEKFSKVIEKHKVWHHIDACVGGVALFSEKYRFLTESFFEADSITVDCHKLLNINQQCSMLLVKDGDILADCSRVTAAYLFRDDTQYDISHRSFQCGRRADGFKLWFCDQLDDLDNQATLVFERNKILKDLVDADPRFELLYEESATHTCFKINTEKNVKIREIIDNLRKDGIFINYHEDYFRIVSVNKNTQQMTVPCFEHMLDRLIEIHENIII